MWNERMTKEEQIEQIIADFEWRFLDEYRWYDGIEKKIGVKYLKELKERGLCAKEVIAKLGIHQDKPEIKQYIKDMMAEI